MPARRGQRRRQREFDDEVADAEHAPERGHERGFADVRRRVAECSIGMAVADRDRLHVSLRIDHRLQQ